MSKSAPLPKIDPRVRRTRRLLRDALVSLILQKDFASISIRDVTERAEVAPEAGIAGGRLHPLGAYPEILRQPVLDKRKTSVVLWHGLR